ncbi:MAG: bifunctional DNA primase/polymerase, partial [bacterium]
MSDRLKEKIKNEKNPLLQAALEYLLLYKWSVIPLNGKKPYQGWAAYQKRRPTEAEVRQWWHKYPEANIGIICGKVSGLVVLDLDGEEGMQSFNKKGYAPITVAAKTGNGTHFYYLHPGHEVHNFTSKEPGLDFRGDGGYVVAPPSIHPGTKSAYEWFLPPHQEELAPCPGWLLDMLGATKPAYSGGNREDSLVKVLNGLPEGERDNGIFRYACRLRGKGISRLEAEVLICSSAASCRPPFPKEQALRKIEQAWKYDGPAISSPEDINLANVFEKPSLLFLAKLKKSDVGEYAKIKQSLKGKINLNDLEKAVNSQIAKNQGMHVVKNEEKKSELTEILPKFPFKEMQMPLEWTIDQSGVWQLEYRNENPKRVYATAAPTILTKRLKNIDTEE